jgi:DNA-binding HxlR family transcriptional regulator
MVVSLAEIRAEKDGAFSHDCPTRTVLDHVMSKWGVLVLLALTDGTTRWGSCAARSRASARRCWRARAHLEADGFVARTAYPEVPPRVEYALTARGEDLMAHMLPLMGWIADNADGIVTR